MQQFRMRLTFVKGINLNGHFAKARLSAYPVRQLERIASVPQRRISDDGLVVSAEGIGDVGLAVFTHWFSILQEWGHSIEIDGVELDDPFLVSVASRSR